jgi:hypothetical protein
VSELPADGHEQRAGTARLTTALVVAALTGAYAAARVIHEPNWYTDFDQLWFAARTLLRGGDPYAVVGPGRPFQWDWPLYYPLPAVLFAVPFAHLSAAVTRVVFSTIAGGLLGWAIDARTRQLWPVMFSASYIIATSRTQWSPVLLAAAWMPALGVVVTAKPNVGLAALTTLTRPRLVIALSGCALMALASFIVRPGWLAEWREAIAVSPHIVAPVLLPGGVVMLLAALRWRRPEARLLLAMVCVPHTPSLYDLLLLFFACRTLRETLVLSLLTHALFWSVVAFVSKATFDTYALGLGKLAVFVVYAPVLVMVLRRPNVWPGQEQLPPQQESAGRRFLAATRVDVTLTVALALAAAALVWLPLVTYRR